MYDQVIYPIDSRQMGHDTSTEIHETMVQSLMHGVRLTAIFDNNYQQSPLKLPYIYNREKPLK